MQDQINQIKAKTEGAYQTVLKIGRDANFKGIEMEAMWRLLETCVEPTVTNGGETWNCTKADTKKINRIWEDKIKRIIKTPITTPREALYIETGLLDIESIIHKNKLNMEKRLKNKQHRTNKECHGQQI